MNDAIQAMRETDWEAVRAIYQEGMQTRYATFETQIPDWEQWDADHLQKCRLVARSDAKILGWAALSPLSSRCVYAGVAEVSVYVGAQNRGQGVGQALLTALIAAAEAQGLWTLEAGIFRENITSIALHKACGFREVGYRERLGRLHGRWRDVILLERRSPLVGTD